jgi:hypothetical protein
LEYGNCKLVPERESLIDRAKIMYRKKLIHGSNVQPVIESSMLPDSTKEVLPQGWALKISKKAACFSDKH